MKLILVYVKDKWKRVAAFLGFCSVFSSIFYLADIPQEPVEYAFLLCFTLFLCYMCVDFLLYRKRHNRLLELERRLEVQWEKLPKPRNLIEEDYQRMLESVVRIKEEKESETTLSKQEMRDYYGLWTHQIKTPIAAMRILLQSDADSDGGNSMMYIKELKLQLFKIEQYVEMVLSYLHMEDMNSDLSFGWYSIEELVHQAVRKYSQVFILKKIKLNMQSFSCMALTDEKWLVFVVEQILSNALKYTKQGSISIYMEGQDVLVIKDTGIGIQAEDLPRIFQKGFTGYNGRTDRKATGIGLYLCKKVMDKLNHEITVESTVGKGTRVCLQLGRGSLGIE